MPLCTYRSVTLLGTKWLELVVTPWGAAEQQQNPNRSHRCERPSLVDPYFLATEIAPQCMKRMSQLLIRQLYALLSMAAHCLQMHQNHPTMLKHQHE
jgi:hypothetical protein